MSIDPLYQDIYNNIEKNTYVNPRNCSIIAGIVSTPIALVLAPVVATSAGVIMLIKGISVATGTGVGWKLGNEYYSGSSIAISLVYQPDAWRQSHTADGGIAIRSADDNSRGADDPASTHLRERGATTTC